MSKIAMMMSAARLIVNLNRVHLDFALSGSF